MKKKENTHNLHDSWHVLSCGKTDHQDRASGRATEQTSETAGKRPEEPRRETVRRILKESTEAPDSPSSRKQ